MCGACGILQNGRDWTENFGQDGKDQPVHAFLAGRRQRIELVNDLLKNCGLNLRDHGRQLILSNKTGKSVVISNLAHVWIEADKLSVKQLDPLNLG